MTKKNMKRRLTEKVIDYSLAEPISNQINIISVRLIKCNCFQCPSAGMGKHSLEIDCNTEVQVNEKKGDILVFPTFKLQAFSPEGKKKEPDLIIEATFILIYKAKTLEGLKQENFKAFADTNGIYNVWPYWREFVQNTVVRMSLPPLTIPVFRLLPTEKKSSRNKRTVKQLSNAKD